MSAHYRPIFSSMVSTPRRNYACEKLESKINLDLNFAAGE